MSPGDALRRLVGDISHFGAHTWSREPLLRSIGDVTDLFSAEAVDDLIAERGLRTPFVRVARNGKSAPEAAFTSSGGVGAQVKDQIVDGHLLRLFEEGSTIVLQGLHRLWPPIIAFAQQLAADLGHPVQVNAYVTPPESRGFADHYDVHDVFVVQISGEKSWQVRPPVLDLPGRDQPWTDRADQVAQAARRAPLLDTTMRPGDCLYLPRGYLHSATALGGTSIHLTIGVHPWTMQHLIERVARQAAAQAVSRADGRASLPIGIDLSAPTGEVSQALQQAREVLAEAVRGVLDEQVELGLAQAHRASQRAEPVGVLALHEQAQHLAPSDVLRVRRHLAAQVEPAADAGGRLLTRAGDLSLPADDLAATRRFIETGSGSAESLGLELARRLLLAGVAVLDVPPLEAGADARP